MSKRVSIHIFALTVLGCAIFLPYLGQEHHIDGREIRHAEIAREMSTSGQFLIPRLLGQPYYMKPPLFNWAAAGLFRLTGRTDLATARLPSALAAIAIALAIYLLGREWRSARAGLWAAVLWFSFPIVHEWARTARADMLMTAFILCGVLFAVWAARARSTATQWLLWCSAGLAVGAAVMSKGPQAIIFFATSLIPLWRAQTGRWLPPIRFASVALIIILAIPGAWGIACAAQSPGFIESALHYQFVEGPVLHQKRVFLYLDQIILWTLPWCFFAIGAGWSALRRLRRTGFGFQAVPPTFLIVSLALLTLVPNKRAHYLLPILPMWALFLGGYLEQLASSIRVGRTDSPDAAPAASHAPLGLFLWPLRAILWSLLASALILPMVWILQYRDGAVLVATLGAIVITLATLGLTFIARQRADSGARVLAMAAMLIALTAYPIMAHWVWTPSNNISDIKELAQNIPSDAPIAAYGVKDEMLFFMLNRPVAFISDMDTLQFFMRKPGTRYLIVQDKKEAGSHPASAGQVDDENLWSIKAIHISTASLL